MENQEGETQVGAKGETDAGKDSKIPYDAGKMEETEKKLRNKLRNDESKTLEEKLSKINRSAIKSLVEDKYKSLPDVIKGGLVEIYYFFGKDAASILEKGSEGIEQAVKTMEGVIQKKQRQYYQAEREENRLIERLQSKREEHTEYTNLKKGLMSEYRDIQTILEKRGKNEDVATEDLQSGAKYQGYASPKLKQLELTYPGRQNEADRLISRVEYEANGVGKNIALLRMKRKVIELEIDKQYEGINKILDMKNKVFGIETLIPTKADIEILREAERIKTGVKRHSKVIGGIAETVFSETGTLPSVNYDGIDDVSDVNKQAMDLYDVEISDREVDQAKFKEGQSILAETTFNEYLGPMNSGG